MLLCLACIVGLCGCVGASKCFNVGRISRPCGGGGTFFLYIFLKWFMSVWKMAAMADRGH